MKSGETKNHILAYFHAHVTRQARRKHRTTAFANIEPRQLQKHPTLLSNNRCASERARRAQERARHIFPKIALLRNTNVFRSNKNFLPTYTHIRPRNQKCCNCILASVCVRFWTQGLISACQKKWTPEEARHAFLHITTLHANKKPCALPYPLLGAAQKKLRKKKHKTTQHLQHLHHLLGTLKSHRQTRVDK